jgi:hypothetical protein
MVPAAAQLEAAGADCPLWLPVPPIVLQYRRLLTLALRFAAQNAVTALRMHAEPPLTGGQPAQPAAGRGMAVPSRGSAHDRIHARRQQRRQQRRC